jgi:dihydrofolate reductase
MPALLEYTANVSVDGFIEDQQGSLEWSEPSDEIHRFWNGKTSELEGMVMGRRLYEAMVPFWPEVAENPAGQETVDEFARIFMSRTRFVFSRTLESVDGGCELVSEELLPWARELKQSSEGIWSVGGPDLASALFSAGLVDRIRLVVLPVLLGGGKTGFGPDFGQHKLRLAESQGFENGARMLLYETV